METSSRVLGAEHPDMLVNMANLAFTYKYQGRHDKAVDLMKNVVELCMPKIGANHPNALSWIEALNEWQSMESSTYSLASEKDMDEDVDKDKDEDKDKDADGIEESKGTI